MTRQDIISFDLNCHGKLDVGASVSDLNNFRLLFNLPLFSIIVIFVGDLKETVTIKSVPHVIAGLRSRLLCLVFAPYSLKEIRRCTRISCSKKFGYEFLAKTKLLLGLALSRGFFL